MKKQKSWHSNIMLVLTALIWGIAFVAQSEGMNHVGAFTFNACRFLIGGLMLLPLIFFFRSSNTGRNAAGKELRTGITGGLCCGFFLFIASTLQQMGIAYTTAGKAGFITSLYIIIVPVLGLLAHKRVGWNIWISVLAAASGMYLLCVTDSFAIGKGDTLIFLCALGFSLHILIIDYFSPKASGIVISCVQFFTAGLLSTAFMFITEQPKWGGIYAAGIPILYAGILSCGVAYTLQVIAQKQVAPVIASLLMSLESVFSLLAGMLLLGEQLTPREAAGCILVFGAIILAQIPIKQLAGRCLPNE